MSEAYELLERAAKRPLRVRGSNWRLSRLRRAMYNERTKHAEFAEIRITLKDDTLVLQNLGGTLAELDEVLL